MRYGLWWLAALPLLPVALPQAIYTRRTALRLPEAAGAKQGLAGEHFPGQAFFLTVLGESTVAGVGVGTLEQAMPGQLARALAQRLQRPVHWQAFGENGVTAAGARARLLPSALRGPCDALVVLLGVNDCTHLSSAARWRAEMRKILEGARTQASLVAVSAVPPIGHFSALPALLRRLLGARARLLDDDLRRVAGEQGARYCAIDLPFEPHFLAEDGYHPSERGCEVWAQGLAQQLVSARCAE